MNPASQNKDDEKLNPPKPTRKTPESGMQRSIKPKPQFVKDRVEQFDLPKNKYPEIPPKATQNKRKAENRTKDSPPPQEGTE